MTLVSPTEMGERSPLPSMRSRHLRVVASEAPEREDTHESDALKQIAERIVDLHVTAQHARQLNPEACIFDPVEGIRVLKYHLIGDPNPTKRLNSHYPPGVERVNRQAERRVYGVECAARIDETTGEIIIVRKDDMVGSDQGDDWMIALYNPITGEFREKTALTSHTRYDSAAGDTVTLRLDTASGPDDYTKAPSTLVMNMSPTYHVVGDITRSRPKYYGRGTGSEPEVYVEGEYTTDIYGLYQAVARSLEARGINPAVLNEENFREHDAIHDAHRLGHLAVVS